MNRLKRGDDDDETVDRLSELPDSLILEILSLLKTRDVVTTISLLSKRWKDLWTTIPYLDFNFKDNGAILGRTQINFINGVLKHWNGTKILRFKISIPLYDASLSNDMAGWVGFAVEKKVENLELELSNYWRHDDLPECLFSCSSITKLRLINGLDSQTERRQINVQLDRLKSLEIICHCTNEELLHQLVSSAPQLQVLVLDVGFIAYRSLSIRCCSSITKLRLSSFRYPIECGINVLWDRLESLEINDYEGLNVELLHQLVSSSPRLQVLHVSHCPCYRSLSIRSSTLKRLSLSTQFRGEDPSTFTLWAPNLEQLTLSITGTMTHELLFNVPALTDVTLKKSYYCVGIKSEEAMKQLFLAIKHVKSLTLQLSDYKRLFGVDMKGECLFSNVKVLKIIGCPMDSNDVVGLDEFFPNVEKLITYWNWYYIPDLGDIYMLDSEGNTLLPRLREVEVIWHCSYYDAALIIKFIKFVLKFGIIVQKIVIKKSCMLESERLELQSLQSSFPTAHIILC